MTDAIQRSEWHLIEPLLDEALAREPNERDAFLLDACRDSSLRQKVEEMLLECERGGPLLDVPAYDRFAQLLEEPIQLDALPELLDGHYRIKRRLAGGGMGDVYLADDTDYKHREVAVKVLNAAVSASLTRERFLAEVQTTASLAHPNIVPLYDSGESEGFLFYVMPFVEGESLRNRLDRERQLPIAETLRITLEVAEALAYAHARGFVHRDIKPENILLASGHAQLCDFGIALALTESGGQRLTDHGIIIGTAQYMSPEQASGDPQVDNRSDVYSVACVVFEMLAGQPPFIGDTRQRVIAQHIAEPAPSLIPFRPSVSHELQRIISKALAKVPADRHATITEFRDAISAEREHLSTHDTPEPDAYSPPRSRWRLRLALVGVLSVFATIAVVYSHSPAAHVLLMGSPAADTTRLALLPLERDAANASPWRDDDLLQQAFARWRGFSLVDQFQIADAIRRHGTVRSAEDAAKIANSLSAGRYVRGRVTQSGTRWRISASLFDVRRGQSLHSATADIPQDVTRAAAAYASLADSLLLRGATSDSVPVASAGARSLPSVQAFGLAMLALDDWNLEYADSLFQAAVNYEPEYARANLWLAQVRAWQNRPPSSWQTVSERAVVLKAQLNDRERQMATALLLLARKSFAEACSVYDGLVLRNDRDFAGWFGKGQCRMMNRLVYPDAKSASGWSFHSSAHRAMEAYGRAFEILPAVHRGYQRGAFSRLRLMLLVTTDILIGYGASDSAQFYARPGWSGDTLTLIPYPWRQVAAGDPRAIPPGFRTAIAKRREAFRKIAASWSAAYEQSTNAKYAVAVALETLGDPTAIDTIRLARKLATDFAQRRRLAAAEVLLMVKFGLPDRRDLLRRATALADSLLAVPDSVPNADADILTQIAMLVGACNTAETLARRAPQYSASQHINAELFAESQALLARAGTGCAIGDSRLAAFTAGVEREDRIQAPSSRGLLLEMWASRPVLLASGAHPEALRILAARSEDPMLRAQWTYSRGLVDSARAIFDVLHAPVSDTITLPTPDVTFPKARLAAALGDTAFAISRLDRMLGSVQRYDPKVLSELMRTGPLVQSAILRAQLAQARHDTATAHRWATAVTILWSLSDPELRPQLNWLKRYSRDEKKP